ncbi:MAG: SPFH domain-containing protein [Myxococcota bacterium]|jgi:flotillin|nr:SPFH domain-containing protein [Myxococcota bacterium]
MAIAVGAAVLILVFVYLAYVKKFLYICRPHEMLVFTGRNQRIIFGGRAYKMPIVEQVARMDLRLFAVHIRIQGAFSKGNIPLSVHAIANVKISSDERFAIKAVERFLGQPNEEIKRVAKETLEGTLRGILATMTPEEVNEDRLKFADRTKEDAEADLQKLGLHLDTFKIQHVSDEMQYLDSIGRKRIAEVIRDAEIAESDAKREADMAVAEAQARGNVAGERADDQVQQKENELRQLKADLNAQVKAAEEKAKGEAEAARSQAAQELEAVRIELEKLRLQAEKVIPAEVARDARKLFAAGEAAPIEAQAKATAEAMAMLDESWREAGCDAVDIYVVQQIELLMQKVAAAAANVKIADVALIDAGDGQTLPNYVASYPRIVSALLGEIKNSIGLDIAESMSGRSQSSSAGGGGAPGGGGKGSTKPFEFRPSDEHTRTQTQLPKVDPFAQL